jgi:hypothetical protein
VTIYAVFKQGVYRHECLGVFSSEAMARAAAESYAKGEDGYHTFEVVPFTLDAACATEPHEWREGESRVVEPEPIAVLEWDRYARVSRDAGYTWREAA